MATQTVHTDLDDGVLTITINRPEAHNALDRATSAGIVHAMIDADSNPGVRVVILTGAGGRAFSAGADLKAVSRGEQIIPDDSPIASWGLGGAHRRISKPVITAVEGLAYGGGFEMALGSDLLIASRSSRFALPEVKVGIFAGAGGALRLIRQFPSKLAMLALLTGEPIDAETAFHHGLISRLVDDGEALAAATALARTIAANAPLAVAATKAVAMELENGQARDERAAWELNERVFVEIMASEDAREGTTAFAEKRAPQWRGR